MLTAICVFSVVGGVMAFKAKTFGSDDYCIRINDEGTICTTFTTDARYVGTGVPTHKYLITSNTANCDSGNLVCSTSGRRVQ